MRARRLLAALGNVGIVCARHAQAAQSARVEEFFVIPRRARRMRLAPWPTSPSAKRLLVTGGGALLLGASLVSQILPSASGTSATGTRDLAAERRTAPAGIAETGRYADDLEPKLAALAAAIARDRTAALAPMHAMRDDYAAQTRKIERLDGALARFSEEFSQRLSRTQKLAERNAARLMAADTGALATRAATAPRSIAPRGKRPPLRLAAIEYRNKAPAAVVLLRGRRRSLREGDTLAGYEVSAISVAERALTLLETATGKRYVLVAGTNYVAEYGAHPED